MSPGAGDPPGQDRGLLFLERAGLTPGEDSAPLVALAPATDRPGAPRWPWRNFAELIRTLRRHHPSVRIFLLASAEEMWPSVLIHEDTGHFHPLIGPDLEPADLQALLRCVTLFVGHPGPFAQTAQDASTATLLLAPRPWLRRYPQSSSPREKTLYGLAFGIPGIFRSHLLGLEVSTVADACGGLLTQDRRGPFEGMESAAGRSTR